MGSQKSKTNPKKTITDWQQVWDSTTPKLQPELQPSAFQQPQLDARTDATTPSTPQRSTTPKLDVNEEDDDHDAAKPLVHYQGVWNEALLTATHAQAGHSLAQVFNISSTPQPKPSDADADAEPSATLFAPTLSQPPSSPTFSRSSIEFTGARRAVKSKDAVSTASSETFQRCVRIPKEEATTALGMGESWYMVKEEDAHEECEILEGVDVEDDWDLVAEAERFRVEEGKHG